MSQRKDSGVTKMSQKEQAELLAKLLEQKDKQKQRAKAYRDANPEKARAWAERSRVRNLLMVQKAKAAGLTVSEDEVDAWLSGAMPEV